MIRGKPEWRVCAGMHVCWLVDGTKPHVGGVTMQGCSTVLINNFTAAKVGDLIAQSGQPNSIMTGEPTVLICG